MILPAPLIVTATFGRWDDGWIQKLRRENYPPERNRVPAHLTLFHQLPPSAEAEARRRLAEEAAGPPPLARISGLIDLGGGTALRVVSPELKAIRDRLMEDFVGLLGPQDRHGWRPHVTIQNKVKPMEANALREALAVVMMSRPLDIAGLALWRYREGPWEALRGFRFRG